MKPFYIYNKQHRLWLKGMLVWALSLALSARSCVSRLSMQPVDKSGANSEAYIRIDQPVGHVDWLHKAVDTGDVAAVRVVLERIRKDKESIFIYRNKDFPNSVDQYGKTALCKAVENGYESIVRLLTLDPYIDLNKGDMQHGLTPLLVALQGKNARIAEILLEECPQLKKIDGMIKNSASGQSPLHLAIQHGFERVVHKLVNSLNKEEDLCVADNMGNTPLHIAAKYDRQNAFRLLLHRIDKLLGDGHKVIDKLFLKNKDQHSVFASACLAASLPGVQNPTMFEFMLIAIKDYLNQPDQWDTILKEIEDLKQHRDITEEQAIKFQMYTGHIRNLTLPEAVVATADQTVNIDLCTAVSKGNIEAVKDILAADHLYKNALNRVGPAGKTALGEAIKQGNPEMVELLVGSPYVDVNNTGQDVPSLLLALREEKEKIAEMLLNKCHKYKVLNISAKDPASGKTPFEWAVCRGYAEVVGALLKIDNTINLNAADTQDGWRPLSWAADNGHVGVVKLLLDNGARVNATDEKEIDRFAPLHRASFRGHIEVVKLLLDEGANVDVSGVAGITPLHWAADNGHVGVVELLLDKGANVNIQDYRGLGPLHMAVKKGNIEVFNALFQYSLNRPNVNIQDHSGFSPLHMAAEKGNIYIVNALLYNRAEVNIKNKNGVTPLDLAKKFRRQACITALEAAAGSSNS